MSVFEMGLCDSFLFQHLPMSPRSLCVSGCKDRSPGRFKISFQEHLSKWTPSPPCLDTNSVNTSTALGWAAQCLSWAGLLLVLSGHLPRSPGQGNSGMGSWGSTWGLASPNLKRYLFLSYINKMYLCILTLYSQLFFFFNCSI